MGKGSSALGIVIIIIIVGAVIFLDLPFLPSGDTQHTKGDYVGIGMTIHYTDGHTETIHPERAIPLMPLTVYVDGSPISSIDYDVFCQLSWVGDLTSVTYDTDIRIVDAEPTEIMKEGSKLNYVYTPSQNEWVKTLGISITAQEIETWADTHSALWVAVEGHATVNVDVAFANGEHITKSGSVEGGVMCGVQANQVNAMSVDISINPIF